jgi:hypothetical protein
MQYCCNKLLVVQADQYITYLMSQFKLYHILQSQKVDAFLHSHDSYLEYTSHKCSQYTATLNFIDYKHTTKTSSLPVDLYLIEIKLEKCF